MRLEINNLRTVHSTPTAKTRWNLLERRSAAKQNANKESTVTIHENHISIENKPTSAAEIYACISDNSIKISSNLLEVIDANTKISRKVILRYLNNKKALGDTIWEGVFTVGIGVLAKIDRKLSIHFHETAIPIIKGNPADILFRILSKKIENQKVLVRFSGGLDATSILAACTSITDTRNILAIT